jgi:thiazole tautomerase (transcriptional regulator TenI)
MFDINVFNQIMSEFYFIRRWKSLPGNELHIISSGRQPFNELAAIAGSIHPYMTALHLRERSKTARELIEGIDLLLAAGVPADRIIVNDRADVAAAAGIGGVQLAYHSLDIWHVKRLFPQLRVGKSVHSQEEALQAQDAGADYVIYGHIFATPSKPGIPARGIEALRKLTELVRIPVIAIGGVKPGCVVGVMDAGAAGVAVMSGLLEADDPVNEAEAYYLNLQRRSDVHEPTS